MTTTIKVDEEDRDRIASLKGEGESMGDAIARILDVYEEVTTDELLAGFGAFEGGERGEVIEELVEKRRSESKGRIEEIVEARE